MANSLIDIEVIYPLPQEQDLIQISVPAETTVLDGINASGILIRYPEIDLTKNKVGIFSKVVTLEEKLRQGDRIEIYRALIADPKEVRKNKALKSK